MQALRAEGASALSAFFLNQFGVLPMKHRGKAGLVELCSITPEAVR